MTELWRLEDEAVTQIEAVLDRGLEPAQVGHRLFEPSKRLAQPSIDRLEALHIGMLLGRLASSLVLSAQLVEQGGRFIHELTANCARRLGRRRDEHLSRRASIVSFV